MSSNGVRLFSLVPPPTSHHSYFHHRLAPLTTPLFFTPISIWKSRKKNGVPFVASYLAVESNSSCSFSDETVQVFTTDTEVPAGIEFSDRLDSVKQLLKDIGMSDSQLKTLTSFDPLLLSYTETFKRCVREIVDAGFSNEVLLLLIQVNPTALAMKNPISWLLFWREFLDNNDKFLMKIIRKNQLLFNFNMEEYVEPRLNLIREYCSSNQHISSLLVRIPGLMLWSLDYLRWVFVKTKELGLQPGSRMFLDGVVAVGSCTETKLNRRIEFLLSFGWSKDQAYSAFRKYPRILVHTENKIKYHMDFLIGKAKLNLASIALDPVLLGYSIERRLIPRHYVLTLLKEHGVKKDHKLCTMCRVSEEVFLMKYVMPHEKDVPGLRKLYADAFSGKEIEFLPSLSPFGDISSNSPGEKKDDIPVRANYRINPSYSSSDETHNISTDTDLSGIQISGQLNSFIQLLKEIGLSDPQINTLTSFDPLLESYTETFKLRVHEIASAGFSKEVILMLIQVIPTVLAEKNPVSWLLFWKEFLGNNDKVLMKVIRKNRMLFSFNEKEYVEPRLKLIREYSLSDQQIASLLMMVSGFMLWSIDYMRWVFEKNKELGLQPGSRMFLVGVKAIGTCTEAKLNQRIEFLKKFGWSKDQVYCAFRKYPLIVMRTEKAVKSHMEFLIGNAKLDLQSIASDPTLLGYSIKRTLVPRHHVLTVLKAHGIKKDYKFHSGCAISEKRFLERCVEPHEKDLLGLREAYAAACTGKVPRYNSVSSYQVRETQIGRGIVEDDKWETVGEKGMQAVEFSGSEGSEAIRGGLNGVQLK